MGTSSFSFDPGPIPLARQPYLIVVQGYAPGGNLTDSPFTFLPNVMCLSVTKREGDPGSARFRYVTNDADPTLPFPTYFESLVGSDVTGDYAVQVDDRLVVSAISPDTGVSQVIFDGYAQFPEANLSPSGQFVPFQAVGVAARCEDGPLDGALYRDADDPTEGAVFKTDLPNRFNPSDGNSAARANATPSASDYPDPVGDESYPIHIDPTIDNGTKQDQDGAIGMPQLVGDTRRFWRLGYVVRQMLWGAYYGNVNQTYVKNPDTTKLDRMFYAISPSEDGQGIDLTDDSTYEAKRITVRDYDASNKSWTRVLRDLLWPHGFRFHYELETQDDGTPQTTIQFYRRDGLYGDAPKSLRLQDVADTLDPGKSNAGSFQIVRSPARYSRVVIETEPVLYEVAVILAPGFMIAQGDGASAAAMKPFDRDEILFDRGGNQANLRKYRWFIFDECGDGHWDFDKQAWSTDVGGTAEQTINLNSVFNPDAMPADKRKFVHRYRPGRDELISTYNNDPLGQPLRSQLDVSTDLKTIQPGVWDGSSGTWQPVNGGWRLLKDRLGIEVTVDNPNAWNIGRPPAGLAGKTASDSAGKLNLIELLTSNGSRGGIPNKPCYFRLTTVIPSDFGIEAVAEKRDAAATRFQITTRVDCRDHFKKRVVDVSSPYNPTQGGGAKEAQILLRDDTEAAVQHANALRAVGERADWSGTVTIPRFTVAYDIGDQVSGITGRNVSFRSNAGAGTGESPTYPTIVSLTWNFDGQQSTTIELNDSLEDPILPDPIPGLK